MITGAVDEAVALLRAGVDALLAAPVEGLDGPELARMLEAVEVERRRLEAVDQRLLATASTVGLGGTGGLAGALGSLLRVDAREAKTRIGRSIDLGPRRSLTGEPLEPILPVAAAAVAAGELSAVQAEVVIECLERLSPAAPAIAWSITERVLVQAARHEPPRLLRRTAADLLARLDPDGLEPIEDRAERRRHFSLVKKSDGTSVPRGVWTVELTAFWETILDSLAAPRPGDGLPDERSAGQRRHDAMLEAAHRLLRSATLPAAGGIPVTVLATTTITDLTAAAQAAQAAQAVDGVQAVDGPAAPGFGLAGLAAGAGLDGAGLGAMGSAGLARLGHGQQLSVTALLALACEAQIVPVIFNDAGGIVAYGREHRLATRGQRLALIARDQGCTFPGCDRPAAWTEVHHIVEWAAGGPTDLDNMILVCAHHHRSFQAAGWTVRMAHDGQPEWLPPAWLDAEQTPRRNTAHHPPDIHFPQPTTAA